MVQILIEKLDKLTQKDLMELCDTTEATMLDTFGFTIGFQRWQPPLRHDLEVYFKGVILVPERHLIVARVDGTIAGSIQLLFVPIHSAFTFAVSVDNHFVAPWARNFGFATKLLEFAESYSKNKGRTLIKLNVRSDMDAAINLYKKANYKRWGVLKKYAMVNKHYVSGYFYSKDL